MVLVPLDFVHPELYMGRTCTSVNLALMNRLKSILAQSRVTPYDGQLISTMLLPDIVIRPRPTGELPGYREICAPVLTVAYHQRSRTLRPAFVT